MKIKVAWIGKTKEPAIQALTDEYLKRISHYADVAGVALKDEAAILSLAAEKSSGSKKSATSWFSLIRGESSIHPRIWPSFWSASR